MAQKTCARDPCTLHQKVKNQSAHDPKAWIANFRRIFRHEDYFVHGNSKKTKCLVISPDVGNTVPIGYRKIKWFHLTFLHTDQHIINVIQTEKITDIVITGGPRYYRKFLKIEKMLHNIELISTSHKMKVTSQDAYHYLMVKNNYMEDNAKKSPVFGSGVTVNSTGWKELIEELVKNRKIANVNQTKVAIVTGCHGQPNGEDGWSDSSNVEATIFNRDQGYMKHLNATKYANGLTLMPFNIADPYVFIELKKHDPDVIILSWCYSYGGKFHQELTRILNKKYSLIFGLTGPDAAHWTEEVGELPLPRRTKKKKNPLVIGQILDNHGWMGENI